MVRLDIAFGWLVFVMYFAFVRLFFVFFEFVFREGRFLVWVGVLS